MAARCQVSTKELTSLERNLALTFNLTKAKRFWPGLMRVKLEPLGKTLFFNRGEGIKSRVISYNYLGVLYKQSSAPH